MRGAVGGQTPLAAAAADLDDTAAIVEPALEQGLAGPPAPDQLDRLALVGEGDRVEAGQPLAVVEAMKMENILRAEKSGIVCRLAARAGDSLAVDQVILEFE